MHNADFVLNDIRDVFQTFWRDALQSNIWAGRVVAFIRAAPEKMQQNVLYCLTFILTANAISFLTVHFFASALDKRFYRHPTPISTDVLLCKTLLIDICFVGFPIYYINHFISQKIPTTLNTSQLLLISTIAILVRYRLSHKSTS